jgi:hypothetical protein
MTAATKSIICAVIFAASIGLCVAYFWSHAIAGFAAGFYRRADPVRQGIQGTKPAVGLKPLLGRGLTVAVSWVAATFATAAIIG